MSKLIPNAHPARACWHPHYHDEGFKRSAVKTFRDWYVAQYHGAVFHDLERFIGVPLCVFGGGTAVEYTDDAKSLGGTYAVCPKCRQVIMCGYLDDKGLNPRACPCGAALAFNDYFQPAMRSLAPTSRTTIDPSKDPAATLAELCAYQEDGIPAFAVASWAVVLHAKGLLATGSHLDYDSFEVGSSGVESGQVRDAIQRQRWVWLDPTTRRWHVKLSPNGQAMLSARRIRRTGRAAKEIARLRGLLADERRDRLKAEAVGALARLLAR